MPCKSVPKSGTMCVYFVPTITAVLVLIKGSSPTPGTFSWVLAKAVQYPPAKSTPLRLCSGHWVAWEVHLSDMARTPPPRDAHQVEVANRPLSMVGSVGGQQLCGRGDQNCLPHLMDKPRQDILRFPSSKENCRCFDFGPFKLSWSSYWSPAQGQKPCKCPGWKDEQGPSRLSPI